MVLALGDYAYGGDSVDCWFEIIQPIYGITKIVLGNHDKAKEIEELMNHFNLTEQYYSFDYQNVTVFSTDSEYRAVEYRDLYGFLNVEVSSDGNILVGTFYDNDYGEIKDKFTITKSSLPTTAADNDYDEILTNVEESNGDNIEFSVDGGWGDERDGTE